MELPLTLPTTYPLSRRAVRANSGWAIDGERLAVVSAAAAIALTPLLRPSGPSNTAPLDLFILIAIGCGLLWLGRSGKPVRFVYGLGTAIFMVGGILGALSGPVPAGGLVAVTQDLWTLLWCICIANVCRTPRALSIILHTWVRAAPVWAALLLVGDFAGISYLSGRQSTEGVRTSLTFGDANMSAFYFFLSMMIIAATRYPRRRRARVLLYMLILPAWASSGSNGAVVELSCAIALISLIALHRRAGVMPTIAGACALISFAVLVIPQVPFARIQHAAQGSHYRLLRDWFGRSEKTFGQRKELDHESFVLLRHGSLLGGGPTSTIHRLAATQAPFAKEAHNDYIAAMVERGFIGAFGLILIVGSVLARAGLLARRRLSPDFAEVVPRAGPIVAAVIGTFIFSTVYEVLHARDVWAFFGIVAALSLWGIDDTR